MNATLVKMTAYFVKLSVELPLRKALDPSRFPYPVSGGKQDVDLGATLTPHAVKLLVLSVYLRCPAAPNFPQRWSIVSEGCDHASVHHAVYCKPPHLGGDTHNHDEICMMSPNHICQSENARKAVASVR